MTLNYANAFNILKSLYNDKNQQDMIAKSRPLLGMLRKFEGLAGEDYPIVPRYGIPQTVDTSFANAQTAAASESSKWGRFKVTGITKHGVATIDGDMIARATDMGSFVRPIKAEIDGVLENLANRRAAELFSSGWGDIGIIDAGSVSGATLKLSKKSDMAHVEKGQVHVFSDTLNSSVLRNSGGSLTVTAVDRSTRTITYGANISTVTGVIAGDYVFIKGDREDSATPTRKCLSGLEAWIPPVGYSFSGDSFFSQDRSADVTRLAGQRYDGTTGESLEEVMQNADAIVSAEGGHLDHFIVSPQKFKDMSIALGSRVRYQPAQVGKMGFSSLLVTGQSGDITVVADRFCPDDRMFGLDLDTWEVGSQGKLVKISSDDELKLLRQSTADGIEIRCVSRFAQLVCRAPAFNINVKLTA